MKAGLIGCGLIGTKRVQASSPFEFVALSDNQRERAQKLALSCPNAKVYSTWESLLESAQIDVVFVATPHHLLAPITQMALACGKHVFVEKPAAIHSSQLEPLLEITQRSPLKVRVGFNHRYHRAFRKAAELRKIHGLGEAMFLRGRYGHGGRLGMEKEWRAQPELSGGGEMIDQGVHLIDLSRTFLGDFPVVMGRAHRYFWDMKVEDNGFLHLESARGATAFLQVSCCEWKNLFSFEVYFREAKIEVSGLGGSYGLERLSYYQMLPEMGPPETTIFEYPMADDSWSYEANAFYDDIRQNRDPEANLHDAKAALQIVEKIYSQSRIEVSQ